MSVVEHGHPNTFVGYMAAFADICDAFSLTRADRLDIASVLLDRNITTFNDLSPLELDRLWYSFNGAVLVAKTLMDRRNRVAARPHVVPCTPVRQPERNEPGA